MYYLSYIMRHVGGWIMKVLALFGAAGMVTATLAGGTSAIVLGNLAVLASAGALFLGTVNLSKA